MMNTRLLVMILIVIAALLILLKIIPVEILAEQLLHLGLPHHLPPCDLLVRDQGRVNISHQVRGDIKGAKFHD